MTIVCFFVVKFSLGWWIVIDAVVDYAEPLYAAYFVCGLFSTLALFMWVYHECVTLRISLYTLGKVEILRFWQFDIICESLFVKSLQSKYVSRHKHWISTYKLRNLKCLFEREIAKFSYADLSTIRYYSIHVQYDIQGRSENFQEGVSSSKCFKEFFLVS